MASSVLILIPCSKSKREGGGTTYNANSSILNYLTDPSRDNLLSSRRKLFQHFSIPFGQDVGHHNDSTINYMEAYKRYAGKGSKIYGQICYSSWDKLKKTANLDLVIVSALYGLLRYDESIRYYDKTMCHKIDDQRLKTWWRNNGLGAILKDYINENNISQVHNVLSNDYNEALGGCFIGIEVKHVCHDLSEYRSGSNAHRGGWVNEFIQNF